MIAFTPNTNKHSKTDVKNISAMPSLQQTSQFATSVTSTHQLRRQTSLGQLDEHLFVKPNDRHNNNNNLLDSSVRVVHQNVTPLDTRRRRNLSNGFLNENTVYDYNHNSHRSPQTMPVNQYQYSSSAVASNSFDDETDSYNLRDVCNNWFGRHIQNRNFQAVNCLKALRSDDSLNIKTTLYEKVVPKHNICQNAQNRDQTQTALSTTSLTENRNLQSNRCADESTVQTAITRNDVEQNVIVVNSLETNTLQDNALTVRSEVLSHECSDGFDEQSRSTDLNANSDSGGIQASNDHTYKSSSESGRGTMRSDVIVKEDPNVDVLCSHDLISLDVHQNDQILTTSDWVQQNHKHDSCVKIEKMQKELQRILDFGSVQSSEAEIEELGRDVQTRLSIVNESDSWVSNTPPLTPHNEPISKFSESTLSKCVKSTPILQNSVKLRTEKSKPLSKKPKIASIDKPNASLNRQINSNKKYSIPTRNQCLTTAKLLDNDHIYYNLSNKGKTRTSAVNAIKIKKSIDLINCDIESTTTMCDSNAEYPDDLSSDYSLNVCDSNDVYSIRKQLNGLETMYSEIVNILNHRLKNDSNHNQKMKRKVCASVSSITGRSSVTSRGNKDYYFRRYRHESKKHNFDDHNKSAPNRRQKRLEAHVITLARSVAQLSAEMHSNHSLSQEIQNIRQEINLMKEQLQSLKQTIISINCKQNSYISSYGRSPQTVTNHVNTGRVEKLKRFFGDDPPLLRQFLKKLGYEKYARNFETEKIGISELSYLSEETLQKLGIPLGPRIRILQEANHLS